MAFVRPTLAKLIARAKSDIETRLPGADSKLRRTVEYVFARVVAGAAHGLHGHLVWVSKQLMPDTAADELMVRWADIWGISRTGAVSAGGNVAITGVNTTVCPDETLWQTADGVVYEQDGAQTIAAGIATVVIVAQDGGADGNQDSGVVLSLVTPIAGIDSDGTVDASGLTGGSDQETLAALLERLLLRLGTLPTGGGPNDYVLWAKEIAGTTRAWQLGGADGLGTVAVYFVQDDDSVSILPDAGEITTMQDYIDGKAPVTADATVYAPTENTIPMSVTLVTDGTAAATVQAAAEAEIEALILRVGNPATGADLLLSQIDEAISISAGEADHTITQLDGIAPADVAQAVGEIPKLGTVTWS